VGAKYDIWKALPLASLALLGACTHLAERVVADALSGTGDTFSSDEDPALVGAATPFALKTMESLLADLPKHEPLLRALAGGFTGYSYAFVQEEADELQEKNPELATAMHLRARKLFLRARGYGLRGLDAAHPGLADALLNGNAEARKVALAATEAKDVPTMYWTGAAWALAISDGKDQMQLVGQLPAVGELMERALALDPDWDDGSLHEFFVSFDAARDKTKEAKAHLDRAEALDGHHRLGVRVSYAEGVLAPKQDKAGFVKLLTEVLAFDVDQPAARKDRLANVLAQRRAKWLLKHLDDLFV
jgi:predicted anti-sigma-YlaC factor YlaD